MQFDFHQPPARLADTVKVIWAARGTKEEFGSPEPIVPDGCVEIIFNLADPFRNGEVQPLVLLAGQMTGPVIAVPTGDVDLIGVRFWPGRAGAALRTPMWELQDRLVEASAVITGMDRLMDDLRNVARSDRLDHLCNVLARSVGSADARSLTPIDRALMMIDSRRGNIAIDRIAESVGMTRRHLERRFREEVGVPAKLMARIARVHAVLQVIQEQPCVTGADIAAQCGYSDQPHMIRECKALTGRTPARLTETKRSLAGLMREEVSTHSA